ncbi:hypothetical protein Pint_31158 [Pistacia integerrima]|uniref:Uncharacterized protein n=1 Tax=Pistacia integerrima TaxID=434235 RepID=A0ACC0XNS5_9ROSI|nr:hypothetical protein Pint_31158 [Pistacia integerrima]
MKSLIPLSEECSIHRVQESLRQLDENAYTPRVVSIGPIHHGKQQLKAMEDYKLRYLQRFLLRTDVHLEEFIKFIGQNETKVRNCYAENIEFNSDDFEKMILMDAAFIFEVLLRHMEKGEFVYDRLYGNPLKKFDIKDDLYMLENQLPFFILADLFRQANISNNEENLSILNITHSFTKTYWDYLGIEESFDETKYLNVKHLVDFLRISIVPSEPQRRVKPEILTTPSVTKLYQAGVKFKLGSSKNLFDIKFHNGILEIPRITTRSTMEYAVKNILAFEKNQGRIENFLNDYVIFINYLANSPKDAEILVQHGIIHNPIGDSERLSTLFHSLVERATLSPDYFHFSSLVEELNGYCRRPWNKWKATLKQDYFKTPWTTVSVIAASILLVLTLIQTICSILQLK